MAIKSLLAITTAKRSLAGEYRSDPTPAAPFQLSRIGFASKQAKADARRAAAVGSRVRLGELSGLFRLLRYATPSLLMSLDVQLGPPIYDGSLFARPIV